MLIPYIYIYIYTEDKARLQWYGCVKNFRYSKAENFEAVLKFYIFAHENEVITVNIQNYINDYSLC